MPEREADGASSRVVCLILAAGEGRRMGCPKACLPLGDNTSLATIALACREAGVPALVVTGAHRQAVTEEASRCELDVIQNPGWASGRTSSIQVGWRAAGRTAVLVWPVDVPFVHPGTVRRLLGGASRRPRTPAFRGRRGHPVLLPACVREEVLALGPDQALHDVTRLGAEEVTVEDEGILVDLNTPFDHKAALERLRHVRHEPPYAENLP